MLVRYYRCLTFLLIAVTLYALLFCWTKVFVSISLEAVGKKAPHWLSTPSEPPPSSIRLSPPASLGGSVRNLTSDAPARIASVLATLTLPTASLNVVANTLTIGSRIHPIFIDSRNAYWNPSIISLPAHAPAEYLLLARVLTNGLYQQTVVCMANWTDWNEALQCTGEPKVLDISPTAARLCGQTNSSAWKILATIPGLHDGRLMWTDRGEVLMIGGTQSQHTCFSLSLLTLSSPAVYEPLHALLPKPPISYPTLTELRRPPPYAPIEKNWIMFFSPDYGTYAQYELAPAKRTFAKLIGNGYVTQNLTSELEAPCLGFPHPVSSGPEVEENPKNGFKKDGWHQATNSLRLVLCDREDRKCRANEGMEVFIAVVQKKRHNRLGLVSRYERVVVMWEGKPPFRMVAIGKARIIFEGDGWGSISTKGAGATAINNVTMSALSHAIVPLTNVATLPAPMPTQQTGPELRLQKRRGRQHFTFMVSIAFDHSQKRKEKDVKRGPGVAAEPEEMYMGYLDDYLIAGMGIGDEGMGVVRMGVRELVAGLAVCPGLLT